MPSAIPWARFATRTCQCRCGSPARDVRWRNDAATNPFATIRRVPQASPHTVLFSTLFVPRLTKHASRSNHSSASASAASQASTTACWTSGSPSAYRTDTDLGTENVRSNPGTRRGCAVRTLAQLSRQEIDRDPVRRLEARQNELRHLGQLTMSPTEQEALHEQLVTTSGELRTARRAEAAEQAFNRYASSPLDEARTTRITTLAHHTLTNQPGWVIDHIRHLHDHHQLATADTAQLATRIIAAAAHRDIHGELPPAWPAPPALAVDVVGPGIEVG